MKYNIVLYSVKSFSFFKFDILIRIISDDIPIAITNNTNYSLNNLRSNTNYNLKIQYITEQGESRLSDPTVFHTEDECKLKSKFHKRFIC